jgi:endonuclease III
MNEPATARRADIPSPPVRPAPDPRRAALALEAHRRLCVAYECPIAYFQDLAPLDELVSSLLSHRTRNADSARAFRALRVRFPSREAVRDVPVAEVEARYRRRHLAGGQGAGPPAHPAGHHGGTRQPGSRPPRGYGPRGGAWVALVPARRRAEDRGGGAVLQRSARAGAAGGQPPPPGGQADRPPPALAPGRTVARALEGLLPPDWTAQQVYDHHEVFMLHGQRCCFLRSPACGRSVLLDLCPEGQSRRAGAARPGAAAPSPEP